MAVRLFLLILFVAAGIGTGYFLWKSETTLRDAAERARGFDASGASAARAVFDLRAAQQAYVAAGQGEPFWIEKVTAGLSELKASIDGLRAQATTPGAQTALDEALGLVQDFEEMDRRAREYARNDQRLLASDLIFSDGLEMTGGTIAALDEARNRERESIDRTIAGTRRLELIALSGFAAFGLIVVLLLVPVRRHPHVQPAAAVPGDTAQHSTTPLDPLDLALSVDPHGPGWDHRTAADQPKAGSRQAIDLDSVATVCTELAKVVDTRSLPAILERTATALDASGIVLWIADPDGRELTPIVSHGYSPQLVNRLGTITREARNVTAAAFRTGLLQTVPADAVSSGAIAAPLVTPIGAVGVMAAEVRDKGEEEPAKLAAATIIAAQLATLVGPPVSRAQQKADASA